MRSVRAALLLLLLGAASCVGPLEGGRSAIAFDSTAPVGSRARGRVLVVATYNLQGLEGLDGRFDLARVAAVISSLDADVVALEELGDPEELGGGGAPERLAALLGRTLVFAPTHEDRGRRFGNGVLTRLPVKRAVKHELTVPPMEPRCAIEVELALDEKLSFTFFAAHLGLAPGERGKQVDELAGIVGARRGPVLVAGDMNHWSFLRDRALEERGFTDVARALDRREDTFPADRPHLRLDRFYANTLVEPLEVHAVRDAATAVASDHVPLVGRFEVLGEAR